MQTGSGRAPLIIAIVAALVTYAAFGPQTPFGFLHRLGHHKITISTDKPADAAEEARQKAEDARQAAEDARQEAEDRAQDEADRAQDLREKAQELGERASQIAAAAGEKAVAAVTPLTAVPAPPAPPAPPAAPFAGAEVRALEPFDSVTLENATATITVGAPQSVSFSGTAGHIDTKVRDGKLTVSGAIPGVQITITVPHLKALQVNGSGKVSLVGLRDPIAIKANGAIQLSANGTVESAELVINGPSKFDFAKLQAKNLTVEVNGVGDADVYATENLVADVKGVGHIRYRGDPHLVTKINGPGTVQRLASDAG